MANGRLLLGLAVLAGLFGAAPARAQDDDGDTWSVEEGDCDDSDPEVNPGVAADKCGDHIDNDCNGWYDDGCDYTVRQGSLRGGGGCSGNQQNAPPPSGAAAWVALPLVLRRRWTR